MSDAWSLNSALPVVSSVTLGTSFHFSAPWSTVINTVLTLLQIELSLRLYLINGKYLIKPQSLRHGLGILSTSNSQTLGNNEMIQVFIQMFVWLGRDRLDVWVRYIPVRRLLEKSSCKSLHQVYLESLVQKEILVSEPMTFVFEMTLYLPLV